MKRRWKVGLAILGLVAAGTAAAAAVTWSRLPQVAADRAGKALGRPVTIGTLHLVPGRWLGVELRDARVANLPGGTRPDMATLAVLTAEVALWPLLHGTVVARNVRVDGADILLEKVGGQPNWRDGPRKPERPDDGRPGFPTLLGATLKGAVTFRTTSGTPLVTTLDGVRIEAQAADQPVHLVGPGSYQGAPVVLDLRLGSFDQLHDAATPFPADIRMTSGDTVLHFVGTMTRPLDVDGADGRLTLNAPSPGPLEKIAGMDATPAPPLRLDGAFEHRGPLWRMQGAKGALGDAELEDGTLELREGSAEDRTPDKVGVALRFGTVDVDRLLAGFGNGNKEAGKGGDGSAFVPQAEPDPQVRATLQAAGLSYQKIRFARPSLSVALEPGVLKLDGVSFGALGGTVRLDGEVRAVQGGKAGAVSATMAADGLEVSGLRQALGIGELPLAGRMDVHAVAAGTAATAEAALRSGRASVVATMRGGSVSAQLVDLASQDVAGLLRPSREMVAVSCLLLAAEVRGGVATVETLRLRSAAGTIVARGRADLLRETLDLVVASEARTTGALALDVPVRVAGRLDGPSVAPAGAAAGRAALAGGLPGSMPAALRTHAQRSGCAR